MTYLIIIIKFLLWNYLDISEFIGEIKEIVINFIEIMQMQV